MDGASQIPRPGGGEFGGENCIRSSGSKFMPASGSHALGSVEMFDGDVALFKRTQKRPWHSCCWVGFGSRQPTCEWHEIDTISRSSPKGKVRRWSLGRRSCSRAKPRKERCYVVLATEITLQESVISPGKAAGMAPLTCVRE